MLGLDALEALFVVWAFVFQVCFTVHFALRRRLFESYTLRVGWIMYALSIPAVAISIVLLLGGASWSFWPGGFLFPVFAAYGYRVDYVKSIQWRRPLRPSVAIPYVLLYFGTTMFYWWPLGLLSRPLWYAFGVLFVIGTILNLTSH
jgi:hypothetical protein